MNKEIIQSVLIALSVIFIDKIVSGEKERQKNVFLLLGTFVGFYLIKKS